MFRQVVNSTPFLRTKGWSKSERQSFGRVVEPKERVHHSAHNVVRHQQFCGAAVLALYYRFVALIHELMTTYTFICAKSAKGRNARKPVVFHFCSSTVNTSVRICSTLNRKKRI